MIVIMSSMAVMLRKLISGSWALRRSFLRMSRLTATGPSFSSLASAMRCLLDARAQHHVGEEDSGAVAANRVEDLDDRLVLDAGVGRDDDARLVREGPFHLAHALRETREVVHLRA